MKKLTVSSLANDKARLMIFTRPLSNGFLIAFRGRFAQGLDGLKRNDVKTFL